jgi:hypothetical protein
MAIIVVATAIPVPEYRDAALGAALRGKLTGPLDVQMLTPHPAGSAQKGAL